MAEIDDFDLDRSTAQAWAEFSVRLAEVISMIDESADLTIRSFSASADPPPFVRLSSPARLAIRAEAAANSQLGASYQLTGAQMTAALVPSAGWVRVNAKLTGIKVGEECQMVVHGANGTEAVASSWVITEKAASMAGGWPITGNAAIAPEDVESIEIETTAGRHLVTVDF